MLNKITQKSQKGFGLLELMLSMVIVALLLIMVTRYFESTRNAARIQQAITQINQAFAGAQNIALGAGSYAGIDTSTVTAFLPNQDGSSPWPSVATSVLTVTGTPGTTLEIQITADTEASCNAVVKAFIGNKYVTKTPSCTKNVGTVTFNLEPSA